MNKINVGIDDIKKFIFEILEKRNIKIDTKRLSMLLNCPIIETSALKQTGLDALVDEAVKVANKKEVSLPKDIF